MAVAVVVLFAIGTAVYLRFFHGEEVTPSPTHVQVDQNKMSTEEFKTRFDNFNQRPPVPTGGEVNTEECEMKKLFGHLFAAACFAAASVPLAQAPALAADALAAVQEDCVAIPSALLMDAMGTIPNTSGELMPLIIVWGYSDPNPSCALKVMDKCPIDCKDDQLGAASAYLAPGFNGNHDLLIPRAMAVQMKAICIHPNSGYGPENGINLGADLVANDIRPRAKAGKYIVLPDGVALKFWPLGPI